MLFVLGIGFKSREFSEIQRAKKIIYRNRGEVGPKASMS
jgi:hypothetical protein